MTQEQKRIIFTVALEARHVKGKPKNFLMKEVGYEFIGLMTLLQGIPGNLVREVMDNTRLGYTDLLVGFLQVFKCGKFAPGYGGEVYQKICAGLLNGTPPEELKTWLSPFSKKMEIVCAGFAARANQEA